MKHQFEIIPKAFLPPFLFFLFAWLFQVSLMKYTSVGPVSATTGQPVFASFPTLVNTTLLVAIVIAFACSAYYATKLTGWLRYLTGFVLLILVPVQFVFAIAVQVSLFGK